MRTNAGIKAHYDLGHNYTHKDPETNALRKLIDELPVCKILEIGCGDGELVGYAASHCHSAVGCDYSSHGKEWAQVAAKNRGGPILFEKCHYRDSSAGAVNVVMMQGVLEHMDDPLQTLRDIDNLFDPQLIISSSPCFLNPRGYIWMTLQLLLNAPMSLADIHFISPADMELWAEELGYNVDYHSVDKDWGGGDRMITDFVKRLPKVFSDMGIKADTQALLDWLDHNVDYIETQEGATMIYQLEKN